MQYNFASNAAAQTISNEIIKTVNTQWNTVSVKSGNALEIPADYDKDTFILSEGSFFTYMYGDSAGNHRGITYDTGKAPNLNALQRQIYAGQLPDIEIPIAAPTTAELSKISLTTTGVKTTYYEGDAFDTTNLVVTAEYADNATQTADKLYSISKCLNQGHHESYHYISRENSNDTCFGERSTIDRHRGRDAAN